MKRCNCNEAQQGTHDDRCPAHPLAEATQARPISPEFRERLLAAAERPLRVRRAIMLLAGHASGHLGGATCRTCHAEWPCTEVRRAAAPALEAFADCDPGVLRAERDAARAALGDLWEAVEAGGFDVQLNYGKRGRP